MKVPYKLFGLLGLFMTDCVHCFDPFTIAAFTAAAAGAGIIYDALYNEHCRSGWIKPDLQNLSKTLEEKLHGQHLVKKVIIGALKGHLMDNNPKKALVMSLHGWTGGGKNYVSKFMAEKLFHEGLKSKYVHLFSGTYHFPNEIETYIHRWNLQNWIKGNVSQCHQSLFIFDEVDKMPPGIIDSIKPFIDYHGIIDGVDFRHSIFIFLSNTGGPGITRWMIERWKEGQKRDEISLKDLEYLIEKGLFNEANGLHDSDIVHHNLVDFYVPFLPLERKHVELCVMDELLRRGHKPTQNLIKKVADEMNYYPPGTGVYSVTGCKRVAQKVSYILAYENYDNLFD